MVDGMFHLPEARLTHWLVRGLHLKGGRARQGYAPVVKLDGERERGDGH